MKGILLCSIASASLFYAAVSARPTSPREADTVRVMSYNTHNCIGMDTVTSYDRVAKVISGVAPDFVALQELDSMTMRNNDYVLGELGRLTSMHPTFGAALDRNGMKYGVGILSKEEPLKVTRIALPGTEEKRMLLIAEFEKYVVCCTHFSLTPADRVASVRIIFDAVEGIAKPLFLAGDMNDSNDSEMQKLLTERFTVLNDPTQGTYKSRREKKNCIDFIYGYDNGTEYRVLSRQVVPEETASDHLPLYVDVEL